MDAIGGSESSNRGCLRRPTRSGTGGGPSGEAPPLPHELRPHGRVWSLLALYLAVTS